MFYFVLNEVKRFIAPEVLRVDGNSGTEICPCLGYGIPADVFSYGIVAWEIFSSSIDKNPLKGLDPSVTLAKVFIDIKHII